MDRVFVLSLSVLCAITSVHSLMQQSDDRLYILKEKQHDQAACVKFCNDIGGETPHDIFNNTVIVQILAQRPNINWVWLDAGRSTGGYRWSDGNEIRADEWSSGEPDCEGQCGVAVQKDGKLIARKTHLTSNVLCVVDMRNETAYGMLEKNSKQLDESDQNVMTSLLISSKVMNNVSGKIQMIEERINFLSQSVDRFRDALKLFPALPEGGDEEK